MSAPPGIVVIGRNEGARLVRALAALRLVAGPVVYVDSGSVDGSVAWARAAGVQVVALDDSAPHTAARGRNAGFAALAAAPGGAPALVQFLDGDCEMEPGWLEAAAAALAADPGLALVTGWLDEIAPETSLFNRLQNLEWHRPAGEIAASGGSAMVRADAFAAVGGFDARLIVSEDDDFCLRLRAAGWRLRRLPRTMARHDADLRRFGQWWRRAIRSGHGFAEVGARHPGHFRAERARAWGYGAAVPAATLAGLAVAGWWGLAPLAAYAVNFARIALGLRARPEAAGHVGAMAALMVAIKLPHLVGMLVWHRRRLRGRATRLIEYK